MFISTYVYYDYYVNFDWCRKVPYTRAEISCTRSQEGLHPDPVPATREDFSPVITIGGHRGKIFPRCRDRIQGTPEGYSNFPRYLGAVLSRVVLENADPTAPHAHQYGTPAAITAHRCVGRELVRGAAPRRPLCAATGCGRCPSARWRRLFTNQFTPAR